MYSKNDYRNYLEHRLSESDDFLAHYGVKGMKWNKRKVTLEKRTDQHTGIKDYRIDFNKHKDWSDGIGIRYDNGKRSGKRRLSVYNTTRTKWDKKNNDYVYEKKKKGRFSKERAEDGVEYSIDLSKRRKKRKNRR